MHTCEYLRGCCMPQYTGTINQFTASCSFQVFDCFYKPQKDSLGLLPFHSALVLRALLQIMIWTWVKVSETSQRSNLSSNIKHFKWQDLEVKYVSEISIMNSLRDCNNYTPENISKWKNAEALGKISLLTVVSITRSGHQEWERERGKERIIRIVHVLSVYAAFCKPPTTSNTTHWPDLRLLQLVWTFIS